MMTWQQVGDTLITKMQQQASGAAMSYGNAVTSYDVGTTCQLIKIEYKGGDVDMGLTAQEGPATAHLNVNCMINKSDLCCMIL